MHPVEARGHARLPRGLAGAFIGGLVLAVALGLPSVRAETPATEPLAEVNGETITRKDLERAVGARLSQLEEQIYQLKRQTLDALIARRLLAQEAAKRGTSVAAILEAEVTAKVEPLTELEIEGYYQANKRRLRGDEATIRQNARGHLQQQKVAARRDLFVRSLREQATILVNLQPPPIVRVVVSVVGAPVRGPAEAPVTLVEFSDYHCPFCKQAQPELTQLLKRFPGKIRLAYRDFPVDSLHPQARRAAEAARCAQDQGKFWDYHDVLFTQAPKATADDLGRYAAEVGLDLATFDRCLAEGAHRATVQRDLDEGRRLGITGTPAFFINGRPLTGAQPLEVFVRVVEEELARVAGARKGTE